MLCEDSVCHLCFSFCWNFYGYVLDVNRKFNLLWYSKNLSGLLVWWAKKLGTYVSIYDIRTPRPLFDLEIALHTTKFRWLITKNASIFLHRKLYYSVFFFLSAVQYSSRLFFSPKIITQRRWPFLMSKKVKFGEKIVEK